MSQRKYEVFEGDLATQLGVPREMLSALRADIPLEKGVHWKSGANGRVYVNHDGVKLLMDRLEKVEREADAAADKKSPPGKENVAESLEPPSAMATPDGVASELVSADDDTPQTVRIDSRGISDVFSEIEEPPVSVASPEEVVAAAATSVPEVADLVIEACCRNPKIVLARGEGLDGLQRVRVRSNANYAAGMRLRCRRSTAVADLWVYEGRAPRWKGRW